MSVCCTSMLLLLLPLLAENNFVIESIISYYLKVHQFLAHSQPAKFPYLHAHQSTGRKVPNIVPFHVCLFQKLKKNPFYLL